MSALLDAPVASFLASLSPALPEVADAAERARASAELDKVLDDFDRAEHELAYLGDRSLVARLEDDFALMVPGLADASVPLTSWAIPLLSTLAGPCAPVLSFGLSIAVKVALAALKTWAAKRAAARS